MTPMDCNPPGSSVHGIFHGQYCSGLPFPPPRDLPTQRLNLLRLCLPHWQADSLPILPLGKPFFLKKKKRKESHIFACLSLWHLRAKWFTKVTHMVSHHVFLNERQRGLVVGPQSCYFPAVRPRARLSGVNALMPPPAACGGHPCFGRWLWGSDISLHVKFWEQCWHCLAIPWQRAEKSLKEQRGDRGLPNQSCQAAMGPRQAQVNTREL